MATPPSDFKPDLSSWLRTEAVTKLLKDREDSFLKAFKVRGIESPLPSAFRYDPAEGEKLVPIKVFVLPTVEVRVTEEDMYKGRDGVSGLVAMLREEFRSMGLPESVFHRAFGHYRPHKLPDPSRIGWRLRLEPDPDKFLLEEEGVDADMGPIPRKSRTVARPAVPMGESERISPAETEEVDELTEETIAELDEIVEPSAPAKKPEPTKIEDKLEEIEELPSATGPTTPSKSRKTKAEKAAEAPTASVPVSAGSIAEEIAYAGEERDWRRRMIFYGPNKIGKTSLADDPNTLILNFEEGTTTIADKPKITRALQIPIRNRKKIEQMYWLLKAAKPHESGKGFYLPTKYGIKHIDTVVFDTVTRMVFWVLREFVLGDKKAEDLTLAVSSKESYYARSDVYAWVNNWLILFRDLSVHTVFLCQQSDPKAFDEGATTGSPDLHDRIKTVVQGDVDVIGHLLKKVDETATPPTVEYLIEFNSQEYVTGDRYKVFPRMIKHTSIRKLINYIDKKLAAKESAGE